MLLKDDAAERSSKWILDSGANVCIANNKAWFSEFQKITYTVGTANNGGLHIEGTGTVLLQLTIDGNEPVELELHNVAYAQDARCCHSLGSLKRQSSQESGGPKEYPSQLLKVLKLAIPA